jgi:hypothetical protein
MAAIVGVMAFGALTTHAQGSEARPINGSGAHGIVPVHNGVVRGSGAGQLSYHGGSVQTGTHNTYAIYWNPGGQGTYSSGYQSTINGYFGDVAHDSGQSTNVYDSDTQYYQTVGGTTTNITYSESFAGSAVDTDALSGSSCTSTAGGSLGCVTDAQMQQEVLNYLGAHNLPEGLGTEYFIFLAKGFSTCLDASHCFVSYLCAYHSSFSDSNTGNTILYANMPYANYSPSACGTGQDPYGDADAQSTINVTSHEANETITDALGTAWFDKAGYENGDKCAWKFGTVSGSSGFEYNQTINGHNYYLQGEYSNRDRGCIWSGV